MKILVVDDEPLIREVIKEYCELEEYNVVEANNGLEALEIVKKEEIDIIVLDIMMPKLDGFSTLKKIKEIKNTPVILLSARKEEFDKLMGFELGSDDYLTKPFSPKELIARIKAITKRSKNEIEVFKYEDLILDFKGHTLIIDDQEVKLTPKEYELLTYFIKNQNQALSREQLLNKL
jgi:DNA-binding response OmpR family regulator